MRRFAALLILSLSAASCGTSTGMIPLERQLDDRHAQIHSGGISIIGYVTSDGEYHAYESHVVQRGDSLEFTAVPAQFTRRSHEPEQRRSLATSEVTTLFHGTSGAVFAKSAGWTLAALVSLAVAVFLLFA
jgi:hypothetical protein